MSVASNEGNDSDIELGEEENMDWTPYSDLHLINALAGLKATGINLPFSLVLVWHRFVSAMHIQVSPQTLKKRLETYYDFENAASLVGEVPFPNDEVEFSLPPEDFPGLAAVKARAAEEPLKKNLQSLRPVQVQVRKEPIREKDAAPAAQGKKESKAAQSKTPIKKTEEKKPRKEAVKAERKSISTSKPSSKEGRSTPKLKEESSSPATNSKKQRSAKEEESNKRKSKHSLPTPKRPRNI